MSYGPWLPEEPAFASWLEPAAPRLGPEPRGSLWLIGELLPANGGFHHHPSDGLHHHRHPVDEGGGGGGSRLQHHRRGPRRKAEPARLETLQGLLILKHEQLAEALASNLQAHRSLRQVAVTDVLAPLVHHPPAVGSAYDEAPLAYIGKEGVTVAFLEQRAQGRVLSLHLLSPRPGLRH